MYNGNAVNNEKLSLIHIEMCIRDRYFCTVKLSRKVYPYLKHHRLNDVCDYMGIQLDHHDAGSDARGCALIVANTMNLMQIYEPLKLAEACQIPVAKILD